VRPQLFDFFHYYYVPSPAMRVTRMQRERTPTRAARRDVANRIAAEEEN
jgi:hypothetical protein